MDRNFDKKRGWHIGRLNERKKENLRLQISWKWSEFYHKLKFSYQRVSFLFSYNDLSWNIKVLEIYNG